MSCHNSVLINVAITNLPVNKGKNVYFENANMAFCALLFVLYSLLLFSLFNFVPAVIVFLQVSF